MAKGSRGHIPYFQFYPADFMGGVRGMTPQEIGVYVMLLCRMYEENGPVEYHALRLATYCGMREKTFLAVAEKLLALGKITLSDGAIFNDRARDEIERRSNGLKFASEAGKVSAEKRQQNQGNGSTTVQRPFNHTDTDTDTEKREAKASHKKLPQGSRLDRDWRLPMAWGEWAMAEGLDAETVRDQADRFRDYWVSAAGAKGRKADWQATWRNWIRKYVTDSQKGRTNDRHRFDKTINAIADGLTAGTIDIGLASRDPFAAQRGGNA